MPTQLNVLPVRVPIGRVTDASGKVYDVLMTPEFARALSDLMTRVGGPSALSTDELAVLMSSDTSAAAQVSTLQAMVLDLSEQLAAATAMNARLAAVARRLEEVATMACSAGPVPVDWEHPGKVGASTANSGKFTTLEATDQVKLNPKDKPVDIKPTGTGLLTIQPATTGQIENMELGKTQPRAATVTTINKMTIAAPAVGCTLAIANGKTLAVGDSMTLFADEGATLNFSTGPGATFVRRGGGGLGSAATDAASTQTLANNIRAVLLSVGIGT